MRSYEDWAAILESEAARLGFTEGYKVLYGPWAALGTGDTVFLSLNPGRPPDGANLFTLSDERGNSYEVEREITASPITAQFLALADLLGLRPAEILTGTVAPFRSSRWKTLSFSQRCGALEVGRAFWSEVFVAYRPSRVIACCPEAATIAADLLGATSELEILSGWGNTKLERYRAADGATVVRLPHLSTYKLFSRPDCQEPLRRIFALY